MTLVQCIVDADNYLGETPIWNAAEQALWWVNCEQPPALHRWDSRSGRHDEWPMPSRVGGFVPKEDGGVVVVLADGLYDWDPVSCALTLRVASGLPDHVKLHECHCDRQGRLWLGAFDHHYPADRGAAGGWFQRLDHDRLIRVVAGISVANGLAFSPDGRTMYATGRIRGQVDAYDLDAGSGALSNPRCFIRHEGPGFIDGATVDAQGAYWAAIVGMGELRRYTPAGALERVVALPFSNPTKPAFGGPDMATLFVTSTKMTIPDTAAFGNNGGLFAMEPGEFGIAETPLSLMG
ncbi:SMP-30/gluconolactonase/LRE family protein [Sphingobium tyrosinilyticum]|uniref:SMP-30/gluconolactonase/LRE family protein n=1 Tax=Sphingobium tyrosinilyticum TaxID=2715436 RepID=A0ABV9F198_9SPHN